MLLEDHAGDVVRKARLGRSIPLERAAAAARMRPEQLARFEEWGKPSDGIDFGAVSELLNLDGDKLRQIAEGWLPAARELSRWQCLRKIENDSGGMAVNCFLLWDRSLREAALFDTGWVACPIVDLLEQFQLGLKHIFITHSHHDHVAALGELRKQAPDAAVHSNSSHAPKSQKLRKGECFSVGELNIAWRETPGHAADGVTYVVDGFPDEAPPVAVVGDAVFAGSIGGALNHFELARQRVREEILTLSEASLICPGHGPVTTVGEQRDCNPFFPALVKSSGEVLIMITLLSQFVLCFGFCSIVELLDDLLFGFGISVNANPLSTGVFGGDQSSCASTKGIKDYVARIGAGQNDSRVKSDGFLCCPARAFFADCLPQRMNVRPPTGHWTARHII